MAHPHARQMGVGGWQEVFVTCHVDLSAGLHECPHSITTGFPGASDEEANKVKVTVFFYDLVLALTLLLR